MIRMNQLKLPCGHGEGDLEIRILKTLKMKRTAESLTYRIVRHSVDARKKPLLYDVYTVDVSLGGGPAREKSLVSRLKNHNIQYCRPIVYRFPKAGETPMPDRPVVIGAGPAGLFCTLLLARHGYRPLLIERGRPGRRTSGASGKAAGWIRPPMSSSGREAPEPFRTASSIPWSMIRKAEPPSSWRPL